MKIGMIFGLFVCAIFFISFISAEVIINKDLSELYNIGDVIDFPVKVVASTTTDDFLSINLFCSSGETQIHKEYISLEIGEEKTINPSIPLLLEGEIKTGICKIKTILGEFYTLSPEFELTDSIIVTIKDIEKEFQPGEMIEVEGEATKKNGDAFDGFLKIELDGEDDSKIISAIGVVKNGYFKNNFNISENKKAGKYLMRVEAYQKNNEIVTNTGFVDYTITIKQVPKNLEVLVENSEVEPGTNLRARAILHDQGGENIKTLVTAILKNSEGKIMEEKEIETDSFFEFLIEKNEKPSDWEMTFESSDFSSSSTFEILEKADIKINLVNKTVIFTNIGNVPYSKVVPIKIGETTIEKNISLSLGEVKKYVLTAPNGKYDIEISGEEESVRSSGTLLTGNAIDIKSASAGILSTLRMSIIWIFVIVILALVVFIVYKKGYEKTFFGYITRGKKKKAKEIEVVKNLVNPKNKAEFCLSIKGSKQNASIVSLKLKGIENIDLVNEKIKESLQEIVDFAEDLKAVTYQNKENIIFIVSPLKTKTFKNEKIAIKIAQKTKEVLVKHNKLAKVKMDLGISLNYGTIVAKQEKTLKFMSMGTLIGQAKKIAEISKGRILLGEKMNSRLLDHFKTKKQEHNGVEFYIITDVKNTEENKKFIDRFVQGLEKDKKKK